MIEDANPAFGAELDAYRALCAGKRAKPLADGLAHVPALNPTLFPHQAHGVEFALRAGRAGLFYDTGLGKTAMMLEWGRVVVEHTNRPVLMLAPLAVGAQHLREACRLGIEAVPSRFGTPPASPCIAITNYERLDRFDPNDYAGVILDESSILKSFSGVTTRRLIDAFSRMRFRLAGTATPAPNDHTELGQHSEFLGVMSRTEMLTRWFIHDSMHTKDWRLKQHAIRPFWDWVASWARCVAKPSDLGFSDEGFNLPPLNIKRHIIIADRTINRGEEKDGQHRLFRIPDRSATAIHKEKRLTNESRAKLSAEIVLRDWSCGSQNTQSVAATAAGPILSSAQSAIPRAAGLIQISGESTTGNTTSKIKTGSITSDAQTPIIEIFSGVSDTGSTPSTEKSAKPKARGRQRSAATNDLRLPTELERPITASCSPLKTGNAQFAESLPASKNSPSIIATTVDQSVDCSAPTATKELENSKTTLIFSGERLNTLSERDWWIIWCDTDYEQDELEAHFGNLAISIRGSQSAEVKEELHELWIRGERKLLICKPAMFGHGLNWQHCCKMVFCGLSFSYERFYQAIRRCWRFRQLRPVQVHLVCSDTEAEIANIVARKGADHERMKTEMTAAMFRAVQAHQVFNPYQPNRDASLPAWMQ